MRPSFPLAALFALVVAAILPNPAPAAAVPSAPDEEVERVENAYHAGVARAAGPAERLAAARLRAEALDNALELSYQATLAWLAGANGRLDALQREQGEWLDRRDNLLDRADPDKPETAKAAIDSAAGMTLERLEELRLITATVTAPDRDKTIRSAGKDG